MVVNGWKVAFWIVFVLMLLETLAVYGLFKMGTDAINKELECSNDICYEVDAASFIFDTPSNICYCYDSNKQIIKQKYLK